jgi:hypothetical protein
LSLLLEDTDEISFLRELFYTRTYADYGLYFPQSGGYPRRDQDQDDEYLDDDLGWTEEDERAYYDQEDNYEDNEEEYYEDDQDDDNQQYTTQNREDICKHIVESGFNLLVVGHCPTIAVTLNENIKLARKHRGHLYKNCDAGDYGTYPEVTKGCLYNECKDSNGIPRLVFVDTGSSGAFRDNFWNEDKGVQKRNIENNRKRGVEILKLIHLDTVPSSRHFNIMHRFVLFENRESQINLLENHDMEFLFNEDIAPLMTSFNEEHFSTIVKVKLDTRKSLLTINNNIDTTKYKDIYFTSDIHSDYRKLVQILVNARLITIPSDIDLYDDDSIYDPRIITESDWIKPNSLFVLIGDLVDGKRPGINSVNDKHGSFELLLHLLLYNLKIRAEEKNSNIIFTIGNHDLHSILIKYPADSSNILQSFVHPNAITYFSNNETRSRILSQFYNLSPYLFLNLNNNEIICVHGGLHNPPPRNNYLENLIGIQDRINREGLHIINFNMFNNNELPDVVETTGYDDNGRLNIRDGALWTRFYANSADRDLVCTNVLATPYKFIVVGHCLTNIFTALGTIMNADRTYDRCETNDNNLTNGKGCVVIDTCRDAKLAPVLAFVDTALSQAFRTGVDNKNRHIEILHLKADERETAIEGRKYNVFSRLEVRNNEEPIDIRIY